MCYGFKKQTLIAIQNAFLSAHIFEECVERSDPEKRDYLYFHFIDSPVISDITDNVLINALLAGDKKIADFCNEKLNSSATVEIGFRWQGKFDEKKHILLTGLAIKIDYPSNKFELRNAVFNTVITSLFSNALIASERELKKLFCSIQKSISQYPVTFKLPRVTRINSDVINTVRRYIHAHIAPIFPAYQRENERGMNPAYQNVDDICEPLKLNQKKIWVLRSDFILAMGNKNAYWQTFAETGLGEALSDNAHRFVNWNDRYGHPSLAVPDSGYEGGVYYAGLLVQKGGSLNLLTSSGRYFRDDLTEDNKRVLEAYIAYHFQKSFGNQPVVFYESSDNQDYFECSFFYHDLPMPSYCKRREYDSHAISTIFFNLPIRYFENFAFNSSLRR